MNHRSVHIVGAGPASLVAAINLAGEGFRVIMHEQNDDVGTRFNSDFQGLENWSTKVDLLGFLRSMGISTNFRCVPYSLGEFYGPNLRRITVKTSRPLFYLVERGTNKWSLDQGLKRQALEAGVKIRWNNKLERVNSGSVIVGTGPKAADMIAKGIVFRTSHPDTYLGFLDDRIAPKAYAYLLVHNRRATFATCLFEDFQNQRSCFEESLNTLQRTVKIDIEEPRGFGGFGNFFLRNSATKDGRILYVGENAGFQDALWGFGLRYGMLSGYLAAQSIIRGESYDVLCREKIRPMMEVSLANRWLFAHLGNLGYEMVLRRISQLNDPIVALQKHYNHCWYKHLIFWIAERWYHTRLIDKQCMHERCNCVWCRHGKNAHQQSLENSSC